MANPLAAEEVSPAALEGPKEMVADASRGLGEAMVGLNVADIPVHHRLEDRGW